MKTLTQQFEEISQEIIIDENNGEHNVEYFKSGYLNRLLKVVKERDSYMLGEDDLAHSWACDEDTCVCENSEAPKKLAEQHKQAEESL